MIELNKVYYVRLSGERVWATGYEVASGLVTCRRYVHTLHDGDMYLKETFHESELQTEEEHGTQAAKDREEITKVLKAHGVHILNEEPNPMLELLSSLTKNGEKN